MQVDKYDSYGAQQEPDDDNRSLMTKTINGKKYTINDYKGDALYDHEYDECYNDGINIFKKSDIHDAVLTLSGDVARNWLFNMSTSTLLESLLIEKGVRI